MTYYICGLDRIFLVHKFPMDYPVPLLYINLFYVVLLLVLLGVNYNCILLFNVFVGSYVTY